MNGIEHKHAAESLLGQAQDEFEALKQVPPQGITRFIDGHTEPGNQTWERDDACYHLTQVQRRDELGKSIQGKYAMAQVHATLALFEAQQQANSIASIR